MTQEKINSDIDRRVTKLEVYRETDNMLLLSIKKGQDAVGGRLLAHMSNEETWRWKVAAALIAVLLSVCIGLISVIYRGLS